MYGFEYNFDEDGEPLGYHMGWPYYEQKEKNSEDSFSYSSHCEHEFVNVGFYSMKMACKFCGCDEIL